jgi:hypothetical protein
MLIQSRLLIFFNVVKRLARPDCPGGPNPFDFERFFSFLYLNFRLLCYFLGRLIGRRITVLRPRLAILFVFMALLVVAPLTARAQSDGMMSKLPSWLGGDKPEFFRLPPFNVPMIRSTGVIGQVTLMITIETRGLSNKATLIEKRRIIQSAFLRDLYGVAAMNNRSGRPVNLNTVKVRLQQVSDRVLGEGVVRYILVSNAYTRRLN